MNHFEIKLNNRDYRIFETERTYEEVKKEIANNGWFTIQRKRNGKVYEEEINTKTIITIKDHTKDVIESEKRQKEEKIKSEEIIKQIRMYEMPKRVQISIYVDIKFTFDESVIDINEPLRLYNLSYLQKILQKCQKNSKIKKNSTEKRGRKKWLK